MTKLEEIQQRLKDASPGPWKWTYGYNNGGSPTGFFCIPRSTKGTRVEMHAADAEFCAEARTDLEWAVARIVELEALNEVRSGNWCEQNRKEGRDGCGMCGWCCQHLRERLTELERDKRLAELESHRARAQVTRLIERLNKRSTQ